jgi:tryptophan 2,3-dioxygenase
MVLANQDEDPNNMHPYWYARVIGIFHALVQHVGSSSTYEHMDFLWVRWYGLDVRVRSGFKARQLHQIGFLDGNDLGAFGFIDPQDLI